MDKNKKESLTFYIRDTILRTITILQSLNDDGRLGTAIDNLKDVIVEGFTDSYIVTHKRLKSVVGVTTEREPFGNKYTARINLEANMVVNDVELLSQELYDWFVDSLTNKLLEALDSEI